MKTSEPPIRPPATRRRLALLAACVFVLGGTAGIVFVTGSTPGAESPAPLAQPKPDNPLPNPSPVPSPSGEPFPVLPPPVPAAAYKMYGLSLPEKVPADPRAPGPIIAIGRIEIPSIKVVHTIYHGVTLTVVDHGPGHWPGSAMPGDRGNSVFAGHRVTNSRPFYDLDLVKVGDKVIFEVAGRISVYEVTKNYIVDASDTSIALPTPDATVTLFACHPKHSAKQRIVVKGKLVSTTA